MLRPPAITDTDTDTYTATLTQTGTGTQTRTSEGGVGTTFQHRGVELRLLACHRLHDGAAVHFAPPLVTTRGTRERQCVAKEIVCTDRTSTHRSTRGRVVNTPPRHVEFYSPMETPLRTMSALAAESGPRDASSACHNDGDRMRNGQ
jgi:hypothetical protein